MSNQVILWTMLILPWITLFFMKKEDIKRFMPVGLLTAVTSAIIVESGITLRLWETQETIYPLNQMMPYVYGLSPVLSMWIMKYTYGRFVIYMVTNIILDIGFSYIFLPSLDNRGIFHFVRATPLVAYLPTIPHTAVLYAYQIWQEGIYVRTERLQQASVILQPGVAKYLDKDKQDES
ncbi:hypothetical protein SPSIL_009940 [Sporomusa silvacetica DSM 10669]|uniref:Lycopene cyclase domain-containing protein n=1 Tax=Sporomusa silvacetica DSM 10669 TaxID=1123289 RepID=A0ABZ3IGS7_9FIRM|nr:hypothetical protein [Sporomusa silvacetica]OZC13352.1 hypothetical protein SPSIL_55180 [Sporomusa silvacetica DSM 10669]